MRVGQKVEHILSKDWMLILEIDEEVAICRTKDLDVVSFYLFELKEIKR